MFQTNPGVLQAGFQPALTGVNYNYVHVWYKKFCSVHGPNKQGTDLGKSQANLQGGKQRTN
jgi:hypothetical protein